MKENARVLGLGLANVDYKVRNQNSLELPTDRDSLPQFLDENIIKANIKYHLCAGGSLACALNTFAGLAENSNFRLICCIGNDSRGHLYRDQTTPRLGSPQIRENEATGFWLALIDENGAPNGLSFHGAGDSLQIDTRKLAEFENNIFITDITSCKNPAIFDQMEAILRKIKQAGGQFVLSLGGARPNGLAKSHLDSLLSSLVVKPDIIFGNEQEFLYASANLNHDQAIAHSFPETRLLVVTRDKRGSQIRFEDLQFSLPAEDVPNHKILDQTGAGDAFMGVMISQLYETPYQWWAAQDVKKAAKLGLVAASLVIQTMDSRLDPQSLGKIKKLREGAKSTT